MKKIFLTTIALLSMASASVFGMYGVDSVGLTSLLMAISLEQECNN